MRPQTRTLLWQCAILLCGVIGCLFVSLPAAGILLLTGIALLVTAQLSHRKCLREITALCDEIDKLLHGDDSIRLDGFHEGELGILTDAVRKMTIRLREQNAALAHDRRFMKEALEDMSHQLRTPLTTAMLLLGMLRKSDLSREERTAQVQELFTMLSRMQWMLETLLNLSRLEAGAVHFQITELPVRSLIREALGPLEISLDLAEITVETQIDGDPHFLADRQYCTEALTNLLKNCMEHTPRGGHITIRAADNTIYTGLVITDSGPGFSPEDLPHVFERFYRGKTFSGNGYGIGLSFAQRIIAAQHGSLSVRNAKPHGAQFDWRMYKTIV